MKATQAELLIQTGVRVVEALTPKESSILATYPKDRSRIRPPTVEQISLPAPTMKGKTDMLQEAVDILLQSAWRL